MRNEGTNYTNYNDWTFMNLCSNLKMCVSFVFLFSFKTFAFPSLFPSQIEIISVLELKYYKYEYKYMLILGEWMSALFVLWRNLLISEKRIYFLTAAHNRSYLWKSLKSCYFFHFNFCFSFIAVGVYVCFPFSHRCVFFLHSFTLYAAFFYTIIIKLYPFFKQIWIYIPIETGAHFDTQSEIERELKEPARE